jgi:hypothetical protein
MVLELLLLEPLLLLLLLPLPLLLPEEPQALAASVTTATPVTAAVSLLRIRSS